MLTPEKERPHWRSVSDSPNAATLAVPVIVKLPRHMPICTFQPSYRAVTLTAEEHDAVLVGTVLELRRGFDDLQVRGVPVGEFVAPEQLPVASIPGLDATSDRADHDRFILAGTEEGRCVVVGRGQGLPPDERAILGVDGAEDEFF